MTYRTTNKCCYVGYITQAMTINFAPLLFVIFRNKYHISYALIGALILVNFVTQICVDIFSVFFLDRIGWRRSAVLSQLFCAAGLALLPILPEILKSSYLGICIAIILYSIGAGLIEVVINPIIASIPQENSSGFIFTHSFYCWGQLLVILVTTLALKFFGSNSWVWISPLWSLIPLVNGILFIFVPMASAVTEKKREGIVSLIKNKSFILILILMIASGGSELAMAQWASTFAQNALGIDKLTGDILGPCLFALFMGIGRTVYGVKGDKLNYKFHMYISCVLAAACYIVAATAKNPFIALMGCAVCGYAISIMWPGVVSLAAKRFPDGSGVMYSTIAIFGDIGCSVAPFLTGVFADNFGLKTGILINAFYPLLFIAVLKKFIKRI